MIKINKNERDYLIDECGFIPGKHVSKTYTHHSHYYAAEYKKVKEALDEYRNKIRR